MTASTRQVSALRATVTTVFLANTLALLAATSLGTATAIAQPYPSKPIRLIVPYPPGGGTDIFARIVGAKLGEALGQQVVIEQRPGAGGVIGAEAAAKAAPDGYTLVIGQASNLVHIPYKGATPALTDVIAGQFSLYFTSPVAAQPYVQSGRLRQIAVTSGQRFPPLPDVPTIAEAGYKEVDMTSWWGLLAPAGVARDIVARLHAETLKVFDTAEMKERLAGQGAVVVTNTPEQFAAYIKTEIANWSRILKASGARLD